MFRQTATIWTLALGLAWAASTLQAQDLPDRWQTVKDLVNTDSRFMLRVGVDQADCTYEVGESMTVTVQAEKDCFLYLFYYNVAGQVVCLFPNQYQQENAVKGGETVRVPAAGAPFRFAARPPCGNEVLHAVGSVERLTSLPAPSGGPGPFQNVNPDDLKQMVVELKDRDPQQWAEARIQITTRPAEALPAPTPLLDEVRQRRHAVCIGISDFRDPNINDLSVCHFDARAMATALRRYGRVGDVILLTDEQATRRNIEKAIFVDMVRNSRPGDTVFIFFSTHGGRTADQNGDERDGVDEYIVPQDGVSGDPRTMILDDVFARWMRELDGRNVAIILDTCFSGGASKAVKGLSGTDAPSGPLDFIDGEINRAKDLGQTGTMVLAASRADQPAWEMREGRRGVLTNFALRAMEDPASDVNRDGHISVGEAYRHLRGPVQNYVRRTFDTDQTPVLVDNAHDSIHMRPSSE